MHSIRGLLYKNLTVEVDVKWVVHENHRGWGGSCRGGVGHTEVEWVGSYKGGWSCSKTT